jgi:hypothetical protein
MKRKEFIKAGLVLGAGASLIGCKTENVDEVNHMDTWDAGIVRHILPTVNHNRILVSTSFSRPVNNPAIKVSNSLFDGIQRDGRGEFWVFDCTYLESDKTYDLQILEDGKPLCDSWPLKTFPIPESDVSDLRLLVYTCAGGHPLSQKMIPVPDHLKELPDHFEEKRRLLLKRGLGQNPDALIAIGDTIYWDLSGNGKTRSGVTDIPEAIEIAGKFDMDKDIIGTENEEVLRKACDDQVIGLYGTLCRSTPVFFFKDDHDYFENDEANDVLVTFAPKEFNVKLARAVQGMYTPEFLPDDNRPTNLPGSSASDRVSNSSESFGTLRYGNLAEILLFDCRRFVTLDEDNAHFIPQEAEQWLSDRISDTSVAHSIVVPSTPFGWSAGKWLEWYPDLLGEDKKLHADLDKYLWQQGWQNQHDRILTSMFDQKDKIPITVSGDLHTFAAGKIVKSRELDFSSNPIYSFIAGTLGSTVFASTFRKIKGAVPEQMVNQEYFENQEENGFSIIDINKKEFRIRMYKYLWSRDDLDIIPNLQPFQDIKVAKA